MWRTEITTKQTNKRVCYSASMDTATLTFTQPTVIRFPEVERADKSMTDKADRLPYYTRTENPPSIAITPRDKGILEAFYDHNGVLADYQLANLFFGSMRRMKERMTLLYQNRYVNRFNRKERNSHDYMAYFLDELGVAYIKQQFGDTARIRLKGDRDSRIHHDVVVNDIRIAMRKSLSALGATIVESFNSLDFDSDHDVVMVPEGGRKPQRRAVVPDDFLHLLMPNGKHRRYFVEAELSRKDNPRLLEEKFRPQAYYVLESPEYKARFGEKAGGTFLYFVHDEPTVERMKRTAEKLGEVARIFYFTTYERVAQAASFYTDPLFWHGTKEVETSLIQTT